MKILWCEEHGQSEYNGQGLCIMGIERGFKEKAPNYSCRMVAMRLIPDNDYEQMVQRLADLEDRLQVMVERLDGETP